MTHVIYVWFSGSHLIYDSRWGKVTVDFSTWLAKASFLNLSPHKKVDPTEWRFWRTRENVKMPVTGVTGGSETFQEGSHQGWQSDKERQVLKQRQTLYEKWQNASLGWERVKRIVDWGTWLGSTLQWQRRRVGAKIADWRSWMAVLPLWL